MSEQPNAPDGLARAIEGILFVSDEPLPATVIAQALDVDRREVERALDALGAALQARDAGIELRNIAGGWRLATHPDITESVERFVLSSRHARLTKASLETLAIVAYKQPVTRHQISAIRGVNSDGVLKSLIDRSLIMEVGREDVPGRPVLYGTTPEFLERLGMPSLTALPSLAPLLDAVDLELDEASGDTPSPAAVSAPLEATQEPTVDEAFPDEPEPDEESHLPSSDLAEDSGD